MYDNENYASGYGIGEPSSQSSGESGVYSGGQSSAYSNGNGQSGAYGSGSGQSGAYSNGNGQSGAYSNCNGQSGAYSNGYYQASQGEAQSFTTAAAGNTEKPKKTKKKGGVGRFFKKTLVAASIGLCFGLFAGVGLYAVGESTGVFDKWEDIQDAVEEQNNAVITEGNSNRSDGSVNAASTGVINTTNIVTSDVSEVVEDVMPAMVSIINRYVERMSYFGQVIEQEASASGSGIIVGENETELLIATNYHVIADATELTVHFIDETDAKATIKGTDSDMDLAVIAVKWADLSDETKNAIAIAKLGDSESLKLGEPVIAIGNALGYGLSVTGGWVSALNREVELEDGATGTFIQTDAAINPGNSGGALLNMSGEVIGINSNKIGGTVIEGIGYAIPISAAQPILENLMSRETRDKVENSGYLGIVPQSVTADVAEVYGMPEGVFVSRMDEGTPAAEAGILRGDIITKFDGIRLDTADDLRERLEYYAAGETVEITVMRNQNGEYEEITLQVTLGSRP